MEYTTLGSTGIKVSRICLGCMSFGDPDWREWVRGEAFGHDLVERAVDLGINFFDTANMYSRGESERVLGDALEGRREEYIFAVSKKLMPRSTARSTRSWPNASPRTHSRQSGSPKLMQPRQMRETSMPVEPSVVYSMGPLGAVC